MFDKNNGIQKEFLNNLSQHTAKLVLTFLFTVGIIGGSTYILFQADTDWEQINSALNCLDNIKYEGDLRIAMMKDSTKNDKSGLLYVEQVIDLMEAFIKKDTHLKLDSNFYNYSSGLCADAIHNLSGAKGRIRGFVFKNELDKTYQEEMIRLYSTTIEIAEAIEKVTKNWNNLKSSERRTCFGDLLPALYDARQSFKAMSVKSFQMEEEHQLQKGEDKLAIQKIKNKIRAYTFKRTMSIVGILFGIVAIITVFVFSIRIPSNPYKANISKGAKIRKKR